MNLKCPYCSQDVSFREETRTIWLVDGEGEREEKIDEITLFFCCECLRQVEPKGGK